MSRKKAPFAVVLAATSFPGAAAADEHTVFKGDVFCSAQPGQLMAPKHAKSTTGVACGASAGVHRGIAASPFYAFAEASGAITVNPVVTEGFHGKTPYRATTRTKTADVIGGLGVNIGPVFTQAGLGVRYERRDSDVEAQVRTPRGALAIHQHEGESAFFGIVDMRAGINGKVAGYDVSAWVGGDFGVNLDHPRFDKPEKLTGGVKGGFGGLNIHF